MRNAVWRLRAGFAVKGLWVTLNVRAHAREAQDGPEASPKEKVCVLMLNGGDVYIGNIRRFFADELALILKLNRGRKKWPSGP